jgi:ubiquinone/menaquinone biosynthesis C-methylase UbiE
MTTPARTTKNLDPTRRFSNRVADYVKARPSYPPQVLDFLETEDILVPGESIADIGSGTGIFTKLLLDKEFRVFAIEPNADMRAVAEAAFEGNPLFTSVDGTAERTTMDDNSVAVITAAQSFHWFDIEQCRPEFQRILQPGGYVILLWNDRDTERTAFAKGYDALILAYATDLDAIRQARLDLERMQHLFEPRSFETRQFYNKQSLDFEGLKARMLSSSYMPREGKPRYPELLAELQALFDESQQGGVVTIEYTTNVYWGQMDQT